MELAVLIVFVVGYVLITLEHAVRINKASLALVCGVVCWSIYLAKNAGSEPALHELGAQVSGISEILFFLLGAMTIVELIDLHGGFEILTSGIKTRKKVALLWIIAGIAFFFSAILDNLTTAIVMTSVAGKLVEERKDRLLFIGMIVIASNAGGAWSPLGDVTSTMLWLHHKVSADALIFNLFLPSLVCLIVPLVLASFQLKGSFGTLTPPERTDEISMPKRLRVFVLIAGLSGLFLVPVFKILLHLPPFMGMMLSLGCIWAFIELLHDRRKDVVHRKFSPAEALERIDTASLLFFMGILLAVGALEVTGSLHALAAGLDQVVPNRNVSVLLIGILSAIIDNVPMVAGAMEMYPLEQYPELAQDASFWHFLAYCAGTGGSILIIGSAAGVAVMGIEKIEFFWYLKRMAWLALLGFGAGAGVFLLMQQLGLLMG